MTQRFAATLALFGALLAALPASAQIGTPGSGPLTPDGPRRGLGPPSLSDNVPDLRLQPGPGLPTASPFNNRVGGAASGLYDTPRAGQRRLAPDATAPRARLGRRCRAPQRTCALARPAALEAPCTCRSPTSGRRLRGKVVR